MNDIAAKAGVSQATVSYVLNERDTGVRIPDTTRQRILEIASTLGYRRNDLARAMVTGKNFVLGFLTRNPSEEGSSRIMVGAQEEAVKHGYLIKLLPMPGQDEHRALIERYMEQRLAGVLAINLRQEALDCLHSEADRFGMPVALLDDPPPQNWGVRVISNDDQGLRLGIEHLMQLGHRRIGFVSAQANSPLAQSRVQSFQRAMQELDLPVLDEHIVSADWREPAVIEEVVSGLLASSTRPTALLCAGDIIAVVAQRSARALGLQLPRDLSVVGFADFMVAPYADPPLTTISQPFEEMGRVAVRHLMERTKKNEKNGENVSQEPLNVTVPTSLVVRSSTAPPVN